MPDQDASPARREEMPNLRLRWAAISRSQCSVTNRLAVEGRLSLRRSSSPSCFHTSARVRWGRAPPVRSMNELETSFRRDVVERHRDGGVFFTDEFGVQIAVGVPCALGQNPPFESQMKAHLPLDKIRKNFHERAQVASARSSGTPRWGWSEASREEVRSVDVCNRRP